MQKAMNDSIIRPTRLSIIGGSEMFVGTYEAKTRLSELIKALKTEKEIVITSSGKPVAKLVPYEGDRRAFGVLKGKYTIPDDIDECNAEIAEMFGV